MRVIKAVWTFLWFIEQCVTVGGLGAAWFGAGFALICVLLIILFARAPADVRQKFPPLLILPLLWTFIGLWGGYFWLDWQKPGAHNPAWTGWPAFYGLWVYALAAIILIIGARGGRLFATVFSLANFYFMFGMTLLSQMAVTGAWL